MATCGSLHHLFEKPIPENPTVLESLSTWNKIKPIAPVELSSFTEIFGELHFKESPNPPPQPYSPPPPLQNPQPNTEGAEKSIKSSRNTSCKLENQSLDESLVISSSCTKHQRSSSGCFASLNLDSLQLCTEGLGFESSDEVEKSEDDEKADDQWSKYSAKGSLSTVERSSKNFADVIGIGRGFKRSKVTGIFPPPISCIGTRGKPCFSFKSYRQDGRFVLTQIRHPNYEILHASREDGCLKLHLPPAEEISRTESEDEEDDKTCEELAGDGGVEVRR